MKKIIIIIVLILIAIGTYFFFFSNNDSNTDSVYTDELPEGVDYTEDTFPNTPVDELEEVDRPNS